MTDKLLIDRELLEQICVELEHDNDRYMLGRELRKALALPAAPADGEAVEEAKVVSYLSACTDGYDPDAPHPGPPEPLMTVAQHKRIVAQRDAELQKVKADRASCWAEFKVLLKSSLETERYLNEQLDQRDAKLAGVVEALEHASAFINKLTVPQNKEQAAIQIMNATAVLQRIGTALAAAGMGVGGEK